MEQRWAWLTPPSGSPRNAVGAAAQDGGGEEVAVDCRGFSDFFCVVMGFRRSGGTAVCGESVVLAGSVAAGVARAGWSCRCRRGRFGLLVPPLPLSS